MNTHTLSTMIRSTMHVAFLAVTPVALLVLTACMQPVEAPSVEATVAPATNTPGLVAPAIVPTETPAAAAAAEPATPVTAEPALVEEEVRDDLQAGEVAARVERALATFAAEQGFSGTVLVAKAGEVVFARGYGEADRTNGIVNDTQTRFRIGSLTKQFTAMLVLMLQEHGLLDISDALCQFVEECPEAWSAITIEHLLAHTSGVPDFTHFPDYESTKGYPTTLPETIDRFRDAPLEFPPGERWNYTNSGYILLGYIIEQVTGQPYEEVAQEYIFGPLGMADTGYDHNRDDLAVGYAGAGGAEAEFIDMSIPHAAGALYSSAEDLLRWDRALADGTLVSAAMQEEMFTAQAPIPGSPNFGYGYGWVVTEEYGQPMVFHNGGIEGYVSNITRFLDDETLIVVLSNQEQTNPQAAMRTLIQAVYGGR